MAKVKCDNCKWTGDEAQMEHELGSIPNEYERLDVGGEVPAGTCPECEALCYIDKPAPVIWVEVAGGCVVAVHGPANLEVRLLDHDNGKEDEVTQKEIGAQEDLMAKAKAAGLAVALL